MGFSAPKPNLVAMDSVNGKAMNIKSNRTLTVKKAVMNTQSKVVIVDAALLIREVTVVDKCEVVSGVTEEEDKRELNSSALIGEEIGEVVLSEPLGV